MDELEVSWDDNICKFIYRKCHQKSYCGDINYHVTLKTIFSVVADALVKFEKQPVEVRDFRKITHRFRGIYGICYKSVKNNAKMSTCNYLDLETLESHLNRLR